MAPARKSTSKSVLKYKRLTHAKKHIPAQNIGRSTGWKGDNVEIRLSLLRVQVHELTHDFQTRLTEAGFEYIVPKLQSLLSDVNRIRSISKEDTKRIRDLKSAVHELITQVQFNNQLAHDIVTGKISHFENDTVQNKSILTSNEDLQQKEVRSTGVQSSQNFRLTEQNNSSDNLSSQGLLLQNNAPSDGEDYDSDCTVFDLSICDDKATNGMHHSLTKLNLTNDVLYCDQNPDHCDTADKDQLLMEPNVPSTAYKNKLCYQNTSGEQNEALNTSQSQLLSTDGYIDKDSNINHNSPSLLKSCTVKKPALKQQNEPNSKANEISQVKAMITNNKINPNINPCHSLPVSTLKHNVESFSQTPPKHSNTVIADMNGWHPTSPLLLKSKMANRAIFSGEKETLGLNEQTQKSNIVVGFKNQPSSPFKVPPIPCSMKKCSSGKKKTQKDVLVSKRTIPSCNAGGSNDDSRELGPTTNKIIRSIKHYIAHKGRETSSDIKHPEKFTCNLKTHDAKKMKVAKADPKTEIKTISIVDTLLGGMTREMEITTSLTETLVEDATPEPNLVIVNETLSCVAGDLLQAKIDNIHNDTMQRSSQPPEHSLTKESTTTRNSQGSHLTQNSNVSQPSLSNSQINIFLTDSQIEEMNSPQVASENNTNGFINDQNIQSIMEIKTMSKSVSFTPDPDCSDAVFWTSEDLKQFFSL